MREINNDIQNLRVLLYLGYCFQDVTGVLYFVISNVLIFISFENEFAMTHTDVRQNICN